MEFDGGLEFLVYLLTCVCRVSSKQARAESVSICAEPFTMEFSCLHEVMRVAWLQSSREVMPICFVTMQFG